MWGGHPRRRRRLRGGHSVACADLRPMGATHPARAMEALSVCAELDVDALTALLDDTAALISSYVVQDPRKELSPEAVQEGQDAVRGWLVGRCAALERWDGL